MQAPSRFIKHIGNPGDFLFVFQLLDLKGLGCRLARTTNWLSARLPVMRTVHQMLPELQLGAWPFSGEPLPG